MPKIRRARNPDEFSLGRVTINLRSHEVLGSRRKVRLTSREFGIMKFLIEHVGEVVTRDMILDAVWGYKEYPTTRTVDNYILSIRQKVERVPSQPQYILTVHASGYQLSL